MSTYISTYIHTQVHTYTQEQLEVIFKEDVDEGFQLHQQTEEIQRQAKQVTNDPVYS